MLMDDKIYYTVYKTTNQVNGKIYIGCHKTKDLDDNYIGSGKYLKRAIDKYGIENFTKEILFVFDTPEEMFEKEAELVNEEYLSSENTYNLKVGGFGGWEFINSTGKNVYGKNGTSGYGLENLSSPNERNYTEEELKIIAEKISATLKRKYKSGEIKNGFAGKKHKESTKRVIAIISSNNQQGEKNSQYGTCWIFHELIGSRKIKKELLPLYIDQGWYKGRNVSWGFQNGIKAQKKAKLIEIKKNDKQLALEAKEKYYTELYNIYNKVGWENFCSITGYEYSQPNFVTNCKKYVKEFKPQNGKKRG